MHKNNGLMPFGGLRGIFDDDIFGDSFFGFPRSFLTPVDFRMINKMKTNIQETDTDFVVEAELPGVEKADIDLNMEDGVLTISAKTNSEKEEKNDNYVRRERYSGSFSRQFAFENVRESDITAKFENGVLTVNLPKEKAEEPKKRGIEIQ